MEKKGFEMSINIIVVAAIALVILVVMIVIFSMKSGQFSGGLSACEGTAGGVCNSYTEQTCRDAYGGVIATASCPDESVCCKFA